MFSIASYFITCRKLHRYKYPIHTDKSSFSVLIEFTINHNITI